ncbi:peroxiredoxin family protein [bacterium]|nr:peroxiredoxin family protein [bacterium]
MTRMITGLTLLAAVLLTTLPAYALNVGDPAPDFTLQDTDGNWHTLSDYEGKVVFLFFMGAT